MNSRRSGSATGGLCSPWPLRTRDLRRLAPITAPRPPRPMERPRLLTMLANSTPRSPAGPMTAASDFGMQLAHALERRRDLEAPQTGGGTQRRAAGAGEGLREGAGRRSLAGAVQPDGDVPRLVQRAGDDEVVPAEAAQRVAEVAAGVAVEHRAGERRAAGDAVAAAGRGAGARQRARREDERILGRERIDVVQPFAQRQVGAEPAAAQPQTRDLGRQFFFTGGPAGEVDAQAAKRPKG